MNDASRARAPHTPAVTHLLVWACMGSAFSSSPTRSATVIGSASGGGGGSAVVVDRVVAQGYSDVREVELKSDKLYEIKARNTQNRWVELYVDARTGEVLREETQR